MSTILLRQGDVALAPIPALPPTATRLPAEQGRVILAYGEVTGHHHSLDAGTATLWRDDGGLTYLTVEELTGAALVHQEHAPLTVQPGTYRVVRQREYAGPERSRFAGD